ncbi:hypothetical protein ONA02_01590 [Mycoplasmopsis felis]|nr:hypothetical protein [Mycoplasmopsis felis]MCU9937745.1 hypothetical protein [Mycoplasmopsis felis]UWW00599.1 hypothetical protein NW064_05210 [Mycoplasmopsis felis]WAM02530.1 hypothetical protein ONA02_01590 [Mycoplasmopsis felis]
MLINSSIRLNSSIVYEFKLSISCKLSKFKLKYLSFSSSLSKSSTIASYL